MSLNQQEIQELLELFPNSKAAIERFGNASAANEALDKLDQKISQLKEKLADLKVKKAEDMSKFKNEVDGLISHQGDGTPVSSYSRINIFLARNSLNQLDVNTLINYEDELLKKEVEIESIIMNAWLENYNDREIKALESSILDLQTLVTQLTA